MAVLPNGLETIELGSRVWRIIHNNNITKLYTKTECDANFVKKSGDTMSGDLTFSNSSKGVVLKDRSDGNNYRIYVDGGTLSVETV